MLPVGDDADGTWLVPLEPGDVLPILGEAAPALWRAARAAVGSWAWSDTILVTDDPDDAALRAEASADPSMARHVLFCGDPASLPPAVAARCAVITMEPVAASDLTVLVDRHAATLHPMGLVVRPHLQSAETAATHCRTGRATRSRSRRRSRRTSAAREQGRPRLARGRHALSPGTVDVRLLTMTPRIDGLTRRSPAESGPSGGRARRLSGPAPARRHHE